MVALVLQALALVSAGQLPTKGFRVTAFDSTSKLGTAPYLEPRNDNWQNPRNVQPSLQACQQQCLRLLACKFGTYITAGVRNQECWLSARTSETVEKCGVPCESFKKVEAENPPKIKLMGKNPQTVAVDPSSPLYYADPGASCFDQTDGDISSKVTAHFGELAKQGQHEVFYTCTNSAGVTSVVSRTVKTRLVKDVEKVIKLKALLPIAAANAFTKHGEAYLQTAVSQALSLTSPSDVVIKETSEWDSEFLVSMHLHVRSAVGGQNNAAWKARDSKTTKVMHALHQKQEFINAVKRALGQQHMAESVAGIFTQIKFSKARLVHHQGNAQGLVSDQASSSLSSGGADSASASAGLVTAAFMGTAVLVLACMGVLASQQMGSNIKRIGSRRKIGQQKRDRSLMGVEEVLEQEEQDTAEGDGLLEPHQMPKKKSAIRAAVEC